MLCGNGAGVRMKVRLLKWWEGEAYDFNKGHDGSGIVFLPGILYRRHWSSKLAHTVVDFHTREWKWAIPVYVAILLGIFRVLEDNSAGMKTISGDRVRF